MASGPTGFDTADYSQGVHDLQNVDAANSAVWDFADISEHEGSIPTAASEWSTGPSDARQGLYWFWDSSWDHLYKDVSDWP
jgi:hypothetical protein